MAEDNTPTNVVDEIKSTMIGYENQVKAFKNLDKNVIGELPVEKNSELFSQNILERPDSISYDEFIKNYPVEELGPIPFYEGKGDTLTPDDLLRQQSGTGYQLKEGVTPEEFRKSLDNFIEQIDNPHIKEGLLSRYRKYDKLSEGIVDQTVKSRILGAVNQDVFYDVIAFNDDLYTTKKTEDMAIVFDGWTEPTPFEDMALAEMEDWDWVLDEQGNKVEPIDPRKNIQGMDEYDRTLNKYYKYYTEEITDTPTNVVDDLARQNELINNFVNSIKTEGNLEFYVKHSGTEVPASSIKYNPRIGKGSQIPGFYTEPLGIRDIKVMGGSGGPNAISNYYKVQVNSNNLLISAGGGKVTGLKSPISTVGNANLGNQIEKINWKIFEQETGLSWENDFNGKGLFSVERGEKVFSSNSQGFINYLKRMGLTDDEISSALRKSGIEGFVSGPTNAQYEVVLLDPNDELGIGKNINVQDATETDFVNNQSKVNQIDELIIDTPTNVVDDVVVNKSEAIDNIDNLIDELPLEETFKNQVKKNTARIGKNLSTPGGIMDFIDAWELGVLALGVTAIATGEIDEIPTIMYNQGVKMYNSMLSSVGLPVQVEEKPYNINFERAINTFNIAEMFMPTAYVEKAVVKEFKKGQEAGIDISVGLGAGAGVPPMQFKTKEPKEDTGNINSIMTNLMSNISNAQKSYPITADEIGTFGRNPINVVPEDTKDKPVKVEYDSKEKQNLHDIYANLYTKLSNASARVE